MKNTHVLFRLVEGYAATSNGLASRSVIIESGGGSTIMPTGYVFRSARLSRASAGAGDCEAGSLRWNPAPRSTVDLEHMYAVD